VAFWYQASQTANVEILQFGTVILNWAECVQPLASNSTTLATWHNPVVYATVTMIRIPHHPTVRPPLILTQKKYQKITASVIISDHLPLYLMKLGKENPKC
jgi:hypothetical protein